MDIHNYKRQYEAAMAAIQRSALSEDNKRILFNYSEYLFADNISLPRIVKLISTMKIVGLSLEKDFRNVTQDDLQKYLRRIHEREDFSIWTKFDYNKVIKKFYKWLEGDPESGVYPEKIRWIKTCMKKKDEPRIKKSALITEDDKTALILAAESARDKALVSLLWDTGARIGEIGTMTISSLSFEDTGTLIDLTGKTGTRTCFVIESTPHILRWLSLHPCKNTPDAPLWINLAQGSDRNHLLTHRAFSEILQRLFKKAGVKKRFNAHLFRHSRATWCAENGWSNYEMCKFFGWELDSRMPSVYISMVDKDVHDKMRESYGIKSDRRDKIEKRMPVACPRCEHINNADEKFCGTCGSALDLKTALEAKERNQEERDSFHAVTQILSELFNDEYIREKAKERIAKLGVVLEDGVLKIKVSDQKT